MLLFSRPSRAGPTSHPLYIRQGSMEQKKKTLRLYLSYDKGWIFNNGENMDHYNGNKTIIHQEKTG